MENLWKLIEASAETDLHDLAMSAKKEWGELKDKVEEMEKALSGEEYQPQEYPKMVGIVTVHNAAEEEAAMAKQA